MNAGMMPAFGETDALAFFEGKSLRLSILDWATDLDFRYSEGRIQRVDKVTPDVRFTGSSMDFINLARQRVDPDTLFFQRRLIAEGDMALAVGLKNVLLGIDRSQQPVPFARFLDVLGDVLEALEYARAKCRHSDW